MNFSILNGHNKFIRGSFVIHHHSFVILFINSKTFTFFSNFYRKYKYSHCDIFVLETLAALLKSSNTLTHVKPSQASKQAVIAVFILCLLRSFPLASSRHRISLSLYANPRPASRIKWWISIRGHR